MPKKKGGGSHGPSIKAPKMYTGLRKQGMSKSKAAAIANAWARDDGKADGKAAKKRGGRKKK